MEEDQARVLRVSVQMKYFLYQKPSTPIRLAYIYITISNNMEYGIR